MNAAIEASSHARQTETQRNPPCPQCHNDIVRRISQSGFLEGAVGLCCVHPFRCQICTRRFKAMQWGIGRIGHRGDRREYERLRISCPVLFSWGQGSGMGTVLDISVGGCKISTYTPLSEGTIVQAMLETMGTQPPIRVDAMVRYASSPVIGLRFLGFKGRDRARLGQFMLSLHKFGPSSFPAPELQHHPMPVHLPSGTGRH